MTFGARTFINTLFAVAVGLILMGVSLAVIDVCRHTYVKPHLTVRMGPMI